MRTSKLLIHSNTNPQNPWNIRIVAVIFPPYQVNCEFLNFQDHFYLAKFTFFREDILDVFTRDGHNRLLFVKCFRYHALSNPVPKLYRTNLMTKYEYLPALYFWLTDCGLIDSWSLNDPNSNTIYSHYAFY